MKIQITTRHYELKPNFRAFTEERLLKLKRYFDHIIDVNVVLNAEKKLNLAEIRIHVGGGDLMVTGEGPEMGAALDQAVDKMESLLKKHKDRRTERKGRTGLGAAMAAGAGTGDAETTDDVLETGGLEDES